MGEFAPGGSRAPLLLLLRPVLPPTPPPPPYSFTRTVDGIDFSEAASAWSRALVISLSSCTVNPCGSFALAPISVAESTDRDALGTSIMLLE
jgi:hypothetical protein